MNINSLFLNKAYALLTLIILSSWSIIAQPSLKLISPNGGEKLIINERYSISWVSNYVEKINIYYSIDDNNWNEIVTNLVSEIGSYGWKVPNEISKSLKIKIVSNKFTNVLDVSDNYFAIESNSFPKNSFLNKVQSTKQLKILPLGNSITFDNRSNDIRPVEDKIGYRYPLFNLLNNVSYDYDFIGSEHAGSNFFFPAVGFDDNAGFPGIKTGQLAYLMETGILDLPQYGTVDTITSGPYLETYSPDIILLHIGTNGNDEVGGTSASGVEKILDEIDRFEDSTGTEIIVFLAEIIDRVPNQSYVTELNDSVVNMANDRINNSSNDAYPDNIIIVDMQALPGFDYTISPDPGGAPGDMNDLLHPNDKGHGKLADAWFNSIYNLFGDTISIVSQPLSQSVIEGDSVTFKISVSGGNPLSFQWKKNDINIPLATDSIYTISLANFEDNGAEFSCTISNRLSEVESEKAKLFVAAENGRVTGGQIALYNFEEGSGIIINDISGFQDSLNLQIDTPSNVSWVPYGLEILDKSTIIAKTLPSKIYNECNTTNEISIEAWVLPQNSTQVGPARVITMSKDGSDRNFTLGQDQETFTTRVRTTQTNENGIPALTIPNENIDSILTHIIYTRNDSGEANLYVNGVLKASGLFEGDFSNWDSSYQFALANEFDSDQTDRFWLGTYYLAAIYSRALDSTEVNHNYIVGFNGNKNILKVPVNLSGIVENDTTVVLNWIDNEGSESGYIIERKANSIDSLFFVIDSVGPNINQYVDLLPKYTNSYFYKIKAYNNFYTSDYTDSILVEDIVSGVIKGNLPQTFKLYQNYPNPFNPTTLIRYKISHLSDVSLDVYNVLGEKIKNLVDQKQKPGDYEILFDGQNLSSGLYFLVLNSRSIIKKSLSNSTIKMILLK